MSPEVNRRPKPLFTGHTFFHSQPSLSFSHCHNISLRVRRIVKKYSRHHYHHYNDLEALGITDSYTNVNLEVRATKAVVGTIFLAPTTTYRTVGIRCGKVHEKASNY